MDSDRFDGLMRSFGQTRSRRQTLRGLAGALVALLAATPVAAGNVGKPNSPHNAPKNPGKGQLGSGQACVGRRYDSFEDVECEGAGRGFDTCIQTAGRPGGTACVERC
jgi:hypothetical protein